VVTGVDQCARAVAAFAAAIRTGVSPDIDPMVRQAVLIDQIRQHAKRSCA
jgi:hypothetical protein